MYKVIEFSKLQRARASSKSKHDFCDGMQLPTTWQTGQLCKYLVGLNIPRMHKVQNDQEAQKMCSEVFRTSQLVTGKLTDGVSDLLSNNRPDAAYIFSFNWDPTKLFLVGYPSLHLISPLQMLVAWAQV